MMNSYATFHDLWIHFWINVYEEYREIIPEIMYDKVPDVKMQHKFSYCLLASVFFSLLACIEGCLWRLSVKLN